MWCVQFFPTLFFYYAPTRDLMMSPRVGGVWLWGGCGYGRGVAVGGVWLWAEHPSSGVWGSTP